MTYKQYIAKKCEDYALNPMARFIGYNTVFGSRMYGTLSSVPVNQCLEAPVAENLMMGLAMGMSLEGYRPVVCFERHDFLLLGLDALVNHIDKMPVMSGGQFKFPIIIRAIVGSSSPINPGPMHQQEYTEALSRMLKHTTMFFPHTQYGFDAAWAEAGQSVSGAVVIIEHKDYYEQELDVSYPF